MTDSLAEYLAEVSAGKAGDGADIATKIQSLLEAHVTAAVDSGKTGLLSKNKELLENVKKLKGKLSTIPDGFDADEWTKMLAEHDDKKTAKMLAEEKWDELKSELTKTHSAELQAKSDEVTRIEGVLEKYILDNVAMAELNSVKGNSSLMMPHVRQNLRMVKSDDGQYSAVVVDVAGKERYSMEKAGEHMSIAELVAEFQANKDFAAAFPAVSGGGGAGGDGGSGGGLDTNVNPFMEGKNWNRTNQVLLMKKNPTLAAEMKRTAEAAN